MSSIEGDVNESLNEKASTAPISWNHGVQGSIRTSFASRTPSQLPLTSGSTPINPPAGEDDTGKSNTVDGLSMAISGKEKGAADALVSSQNQSEDGPSSKHPKRVRKKKKKKQRSKNEEMPSQVNDQVKDPLDLSKEAVSQSRSESDDGLVDATVHLQMVDENKLQDPAFWMGRLLGVNRARSASDRETPVPPESDSMSLISKYFPASLDSIRCLTCMSTDHLASTCPSLKCSTCGSCESHFTQACSQTQSCSKCRQQGHQKINCPEKLAASSSENQTCNICDEIDHLETACPMIWRSFKPDILSIKMVQYVPVHCYCCGREGHFGTECGLRRSQAYKGSSTWTKRNWDQYINRQSELRAISAGVDYSVRSMKRKDFSIKGQAKNNPIPIDDDSDHGDFIRPRINAVAPKKHMNIKRNEDNYRPKPPQASLDVGSAARYNLPPRTGRPGFNRYHDDDYYGDRERRRSRSPPPRLDERVRRRTPSPPARSVPENGHRNRGRGRGRGRGSPNSSRPRRGRGVPQTGE